MLEPAIRQAVVAAAPLVCFLAAAIGLTELVARSGLVERLALLLAGFARGRTAILFGLVFLACAALTDTLSLDGAGVVMTPLVAAVAAAAGVRPRPLLVATTAVSTAVSPAVPQGNPTNLIVISTLGTATPAFVATMALRAFAATALCVAAIGGRERRFLVGRSRPPRRRPGPLTAGELGALSAVAAVAVLQAAAPLAGIPPWWPICVVTAVASLASAVLGSGPAALRVPWRVGLEVLGLSAGAVVAVRLAGVQGLAGGVTGLPGLVAVALAAGLMAAVLNKLPASVVTAAVLAPWSRLA